MIDVQNKKVTVLGLARSGVAAANVLHKLGAEVLISDIKPKEKLKDFINQLTSNEIIVSTESNQVEEIEKADMVIVSPGVPTDIPAIQVAQRRNIPILGEVELAYRICKAPIIAITGSNGKTTTTSLVGDILKFTWDGPVAVAGNIGNPLCAVVQDIPANGIVVAEISSFQLETIDSFSPSIAVILNITPNHLDRYATMEDYANAKLRIFKYQSPSNFLVINKDDPESCNRIKDPIKPTSSLIIEKIKSV